MKATLGLINRMFISLEIVFHLSWAFDKIVIAPIAYTQTSKVLESPIDFDFEMDNL